MQVNPNRYRSTNLSELAAKVRIPLPEPDGRLRIIDVKKIETTAPIYPRDYSQIKNKPL